MRIGTLAYATEQGLGYLAKAFYDHGVVTDVFVVRHSSRPTLPWYPDSPQAHIRDIPNNRSVRDFCRSMDAMLYFETPFDWSLLSLGRSFLMPMHECMPKQHPEPDAYLIPSDLDFRAYEGTTKPRHRINVPVALPWKRRHIAQVFVHNSGHGGLKGRNGTRELLEALQYVQSPARFIVRSQDGTDAKTDRITYQGSVPQGMLYAEGDVFVFPEKFNGLSLPLQEAYASGMPIMCGDRFPMNTWLPRELLIPVERYNTGAISPRCKSFEAAEFNPRTVAARIDEWYGKDISEYSNQSWDWAVANSWTVLGPLYRKLLCA